MGCGQSGSDNNESKVQKKMDKTLKTLYERKKEWEARSIDAREERLEQWTKGLTEKQLSEYRNMIEKQGAFQE